MLKYYEEIKVWLTECMENKCTAYYPAVGFAKIAFTHAFRHLYLGTKYLEAIRETLNGGGDTDTNAAIVGGLIGAAEGFDAIPKEIRNCVIKCDTMNGPKKRPSFLYPNNLLEIIPQILKVAPKKIEIEKQ